MKDEIFVKLKKETINLLYIFIILFVIIKAVFYKESFLVCLRATASLFWVFAVPGFCIMFYWHKELGFFERFIIGNAVGAAIIGIGSYYLGLLGWPLYYQWFIVPLLIIVLTLGITLFLDKGKQ